MTTFSRYFRFSPMVLWGGVLVSCVPVPGTGDHPMMSDVQDMTDTTTLAIFTDPDSAFSTMDVLDIDDQIVRFDTQAKTVVWVEDGSNIDGWQVDGNLLGQGTAGAFQVRFGIVNGVQHAYFTETGSATICDIEVVGGILSIFATQTTVPQ